MLQRLRPCSAARAPVRMLVPYFLAEATGHPAAPAAAIEPLVRRRIDALPGAGRAGVLAVEAALGVWAARSAAAPDELAARWARSRLPGVAEYARLVRSLTVFFAHAQDGPA